MSNPGSLTADPAHDVVSGNVGINAPNEGERINRSLASTEGGGMNHSTVQNSDSAQIPPLNHQGKDVEIAKVHFLNFIWIVWRSGRANSVVVVWHCWYVYRKDFSPCHFSNPADWSFDFCIPTDSFSCTAHVDVVYEVAGHYGLSLECYWYLNVLIVLPIVATAFMCSKNCANIVFFSYTVPHSENLPVGSVGVYNPSLDISAQSRTGPNKDMNHNHQGPTSLEPSSLPKPNAMFDATNGSGAPLLSLTGGNPNMPGSVLRAPSIGSFQMGGLQGK